MLAKNLTSSMLVVVSIFACVLGLFQATSAELVMTTEYVVGIFLVLCVVVVPYFIYEGSEEPGTGPGP